MGNHEGIFVHQCVAEGCNSVVEFDDEPWCFTHSPDEGSSVFGFSARALMQKGLVNDEEDNYRPLHMKR